MAVTDAFHYIAIGNPVSKAVIGTAASLFRANGAGTSVKATTATTKAVSAIMPPLWKLAGRNQNFVRLAGLSGASAVILGAMGSHLINPQNDKGKSKTIFDTANNFHFFHSLALLGLPLAKYPAITGTLMLVGTLTFSGVLYYRAFTGEKHFSHLAPFGGTLLILAWLSLLV